MSSASVSAVSDAREGVVPAIAIRGLDVRFGRGSRRAPTVEALRGVELHVAPGEIVGLLGPNGSGKTTLLRVLCGDLRPSAGELRVLGRAPADRALVRRVGFQPDEPPPFPALSPREILAHLAVLAGLERGPARVRAGELLERLGLGKVADRALGGFSTGMKKRTAIACALVTGPELLLLDEPTSGLDPSGSLLVLELLRELADRGATILMASHRLDEVEQLCGRVVVLAGGRVRRDGTLDALLGGGTDALCLRGADAALRARLEAEARALGAEVVGWTTPRRHLFELLRELERGA